MVSSSSDNLYKFTFLSFPILGMYHGVVFDELVSEVIYSKFICVPDFNKTVASLLLKVLINI